MHRSFIILVTSFIGLFGRQLWSQPVLLEPQNLKQALSQFIWTWTTPSSSSFIVFGQDGIVHSPQGPVFRWRALDETTVEVIQSSLNSRKLKFDPQFTRFAETGASASAAAGLRDVPAIEFRALVEMAKLRGGKPEADAEPGYVSLLDAAHFRGWKLCGKQPIKVVEGLIDTSSPLSRDFSILWYSTRQFGDFSLKLEFKRQGFKETNSGVFIRFGRLERDPEQAGREGYEIDINGDRDTGAIWNHQGPREMPEKVGDWNEMEIAVTGSHLVVSINGRVVNDFDGGAMPAGYIGFQNFYGGPGVQYRKVRIREMTTRPLPLRQPQSLEEALLSWEWRSGSETYYFSPGGRVKVIGAQGPSWNWIKIGPDEFAMREDGGERRVLNLKFTNSFHSFGGKSWSVEHPYLRFIRRQPLLPPIAILQQIAPVKP